MLDSQHSEDVPGMLVICGTINLKIFCFIKATSALNSTSRLVQRARRLYFAAEEHCQVESKVQEHLGRRQTELENCRSLCFARLSTSKPLPTCEALHNTRNELRVAKVQCITLHIPKESRIVLTQVLVTWHALLHPAVLMIRKERETETGRERHG